MGAASRPAKTDPDFIVKLPAYPPQNQRRLVDTDLEELMRANPGRWTLVTTSPVRTTTPKPRYLGEDFEWSQRTADGVRSYYCRYVGAGA